MKKKWLLVPLTALLIFVFQFFRDPERQIPLEGIVSPADGKIIAVETVKGGEIPSVIKKEDVIYLEELKGWITEDCYLLAIFMSAIDVHVNRTPIEGHITKIIYVKGSYHMANKLALQNERNILIIDGESRMVLIQIAGKFVRRIQCFVKEGDYLEKGDRIGRIVLGSQVVVILPRSYEITVEKGDHVKAGETIIALP
jgi:phosphatidylserine decarboxylase